MHSEMWLSMWLEMVRQAPWAVAGIILFSLLMRYVSRRDDLLARQTASFQQALVANTAALEGMRHTLDEIRRSLEVNLNG